MGNIVEVASSDKLTQSMESVQDLPKPDAKHFDNYDFDNVTLGDDVVIVSPLDQRRESGHINLAFQSENGSAVHFRRRSNTKYEVEQDSMKISEWSDNDSIVIPNKTAPFQN